MGIVPTIESSAQLVRVRMLGAFSLTVDERSVSDQENHMYKLWGLLAYLIYHRQRKIPQQEFIALFWGENAKGSAVNALKTQFFRIRQMLSPLFGDSIRPILSFRGAYQWNPALDTQVDVEILEQLVTQLHQAETSESKRAKLFQKVFELYQGRFLTKLTQQTWVEELSERYRLQYLEVMREYATFLEKREAYQEMIERFSMASALYPLEESFHACIVRGYLKQENYAEALAHYEQATELLYRSLGLQPWKELRELYNLIMASEQLYEADLTVIQQELAETVKKEGAFFCEYGSFREIYRLEARRAWRSGADTHLVLLTVLNHDSSIPEAKIVDKAMKQLKESVMKSLRSGDVFTRYSRTQYLIMLAETTLEEAETIAHRISAGLWRYREPRLKVSTHIRTMLLT